MLTFNHFNFNVADLDKSIQFYKDALDLEPVGRKEEATEDFEKMAAMAPSEKPYLKTGVFTLAKHRILWLLVLMISGMITGGILARYEAAFAVLPLLVTFIPMLTDTGGNAGSQSSTIRKKRSPNWRALGCWH